MLLAVTDVETVALVNRYVTRLRLPTERLLVTTDRSTFAGWLGRRVDASIGGAYAFSAAGNHLVLIHLARIDRTQSRAVEVVVAEELLHMRDRLDGDLRRHAKHGHDRIATRVAALTGASLEEIRGCLLPRERRPLRYIYGCPACGRRVARRLRGTWSCGRCARGYDPRFRLVLIGEAVAADQDDRNAVEAREMVET